MYRVTYLLLVALSVVLLPSCASDLLLVESNTVDDAAPRALSTAALPTTALENVDTIVEGDTVVTLDSNERIIKEGAVAIRDGRIIAVDTQQIIYSTYRSNNIVPGEGRIVLPGLINGHSHMAMTLLRGLADDRDLMTWLNDFIFPAEVKFVDEEFVRIGTQLACWEMLQGGTTTVVDMYYYPDVVANVIQDCGMRAIISSTVIGQQSPDAKNAEEGLVNARKFINQWQAKNSRITPAIGPHAIYTTTPEQLLQVRDLALAEQAPISIHLAESLSEIEFSASEYGLSTISLLNDIEFFNPQQKVIGAHVVWPTADEMQILAKHGVGAVHNPTSNMKISAGVSPVTQLQQAGVAVGLGTDGAASNNDLDMWEEMRLATLLQKITTQDATVLPANTVLKMATIDGARAIGLDKEIGSLEVNKRADLLQVSMTSAHMLPIYDVVSHLVYVADSQDVDTVMVDGVLRVVDGKITSIDTERLTSEVGVMQEKISSAILNR